MLNWWCLSRLQLGASFSLCRLQVSVDPFYTQQINSQTCQSIQLESLNEDRATLLQWTQCSSPSNDQFLRYSTEPALEAQFSPRCQIPPVYLSTFPSSKLSICVQSSYSPSRGQKMALFSACNWLSRTLRSLTGLFGKMAMAINQLY